ncbi:MAG: polysaccharide pyruvyl transferase family protein [Bacteroidota bacterium]
MINRRAVLKKIPSILSLLMGVPNIVNSGILSKKKILLRSSWQTTNIGDIGHTPGVLSLLEKYLPDVEVRLWAVSVNNGVAPMLKERFPNVPIIKSADTTALKKAFEECDFLLHGSGPFLVAAKDVARWSKETGKPFGVYGITLSERRATNDVITLLNKAQFVFFRDSFSIDVAKERGLQNPNSAFGPDGAFGVDVRNDNAAIDFLKRNELEEGKFLCVIPRYRITPGWKIPNKNIPFDEKKNQLNESMKEHDHKVLREAIIAVVRETSFKVLICPEDMTQMELGKEILYDPLPDDIKEKVVWRSDFWLTDEALSTYILSAGLFGNEMHSPIMCIGNGIPAIVCRFAEQTSKGLMWNDIGLEDWLFDLDDETQLRGIVPAVLAMAKKPRAAKKKALKAKRFVQEYQHKTMEVLKENLQ